VIVVKMNAFSLMLVLLSLVSFRPLRAAENTTNILFIYVEDLGYYTSERSARESNAQIAGLATPHMDSFAAQSVNFTRAFCGQSVCSPSKGAVLSGLLPHANGIWRNVHNDHPKLGGPDKWIPLSQPLMSQNDPTFLAAGGMHEDIPNLIQRLKAGGVYCALSGKLHVQPARNFPYDAFVKDDDLDSVIKAAGTKLWFFWCNPGATHAPWWQHVKGKLTDPKNRNSAPKDVDPAALHMPRWLPDTPAARIDLAHYYSCVRTVDEFLGMMLAKLEASGQAERTIVVFTGDHGIGYARGKTSIYPAGTHVPLFIKGPGVKVGRTIGTPVSQMDLNPTFLEAFGLTAIKNTHAKSLWPILSGKVDAVPGRRTIMTETNNSLMSAPPNKGDGTAARAVCDGRFYFIRNIVQQKTTLPESQAINIGTGNGEYGDPGPLYAIDLHDEAVRHKSDQPLPYELLRQLCMGDAPPEELYDLDADPWAVKNLITDPAHAATLGLMRKEFADWQQFSHDSGIHPKLITRRTKK
jgi:N-sulfoglucosamine sulfohydrolase